MELHVKTYDELTKDELYALLHLRSKVFIVEQDCVYQDLDYNDQTAVHLWLTHEGQMVAMGRICPAGTKMGGLSIGRIISAERGRGYGKAIMQAALDETVKRFPSVKRIEIEAQADKQGFYESFGFRATSEPFMYEQRLHMNMVLDL